jgi:hypothetical protein
MIPALIITGSYDYKLVALSVFPGLVSREYLFRDMYYYSCRVILVNSPPVSECPSKGDTAQADLEINDYVGRVRFQGRSTNSTAVQTDMRDAYLCLSNPSALLPTVFQDLRRT